MTSLDEYMNDYHDNPHYLDLLTEIIITTQQTRLILYQEWEKILAFFQQFDPVVHGFQLSNLKDISFKEEYVVDSYTKIYRQVCSHITKFPSSKSLKKNKQAKIFYYYYEKDLVQYWEEKGISYGQIDENGTVNSGSCLTLQSLDLDCLIFLKVYKMLNN